MDMIRWNPIREMVLFQNRINRMLDETVWSVAKGDEKAGISGWNPVVDMYETDDHIVIKAELPGMDKKDIEIQLTDGILFLKGKRSYDNEVKEDKYYRRERMFGNFIRSFSLPVDVEAEKITADYKEGVLHITVPKPETEKPKKIMVH
jgi:HSP20 family protein